MKRNLVALLLLSGCSSPPPPPTTPTPAETTPVAVVTPAATPTPAQPEEDVEKVLTARYEDLAYCYTTRDIDKLMDFSAEKIFEHGKPRTKAQLHKSYEEDFAEQAALEEEAGEPLRFSLVNKILKVTRKGPDQVATRVRTNTRMNTKDGAFVIEEVMEDTDHWVKEKDGVWRMYDTTEEKQISASKIIDGKPTPLPLDD